MQILNFINLLACFIYFIKKKLNGWSQLKKQNKFVDKLWI
jgi:hypothetical protein